MQIVIWHVLTAQPSLHVTTLRPSHDALLLVTSQCDQINAVKGKRLLSIQYLDTGDAASEP